MKNRQLPSNWLLMQIKKTSAIPATVELPISTRGQLAPFKAQAIVECQDNIQFMAAQRGHSMKLDEQYDVIEACSRGPFLELFARGTRPGWTYWGNQANEDYTPTWETYAHNSAIGRVAAE